MSKGQLTAEPAPIFPPPSTRLPASLPLPFALGNLAAFLWALWGSHRSPPACPFLERSAPLGSGERAVPATEWLSVELQAGPALGPSQPLQGAGVGVGEQPWGQGRS